MANWNLNVELRGQGQDLVRTLERSSDAADDLTRNVAQARREITRLNNDLRRASRPVRIQVDVDNTALRGDIMRAVRRAAQGQRIVIPITTDARRLRREITNHVRAASRQQINIRTNIDTEDSLRQLAMLRAALDGLPLPGGSREGPGGGAGGAVSGAAGGLANWQSNALLALAALSAITIAAPVAAAAVTASVPAAFAGIGIAALHADRDVTAAFASLKSTVSSTLTDAAQPLKPFLIDAMDELADAAKSLKGPLSEMFAAAGPFIPPIVDGLTDLVSNALPGLQVALGQSQPMAQALGEELGNIGDAVSTFFAEVAAGNGENFARTIHIIGQGVSDAVVQFGDLLGTLASNQDAVESLQNVFDALSSAISTVTTVTDLAAPVVNQLTQATAGAWAIMDKAAEGWGILADKLGGSETQQAGTVVQSVADTITAALQGVNDASRASGDSTNLFGEAAASTKAKLDAEKASADQLRASILALNDVNRSAIDAQAGMEQAIDDAAKAAAKNGGALRMVNGQLDLNGQKARDNYAALSTLAQSTGEAAAAARDNGATWGEVNAIYERGRGKFIALADSMGLTKAQAKALADQLVQPLDIKLTGAQAVRDDLQTVQDKLRGTKSKSVTVKALTKEGEQALEALGFKIKRTKGKNVTITAPTGSAQAAIGALQRAINSLRGRTVTNTVITYSKYVSVGKPATGPLKGGYVPQARGAVMDFYADGGMREQHVAQFARAGTWRVWAEDETGGEAYIPLAPSKRPRSRAVAEETVKRLGGDPRAIQWNAAGSVTDWRYDPATGSLYSPSDAAQSGRRTRKVKGKDVEYWDEAAFERKLRANAAATRRWSADLSKVADRAGSDVADALAGMGKDGIVLTRKMATGSKTYVDQMAKSLRDLAATAKASLTDYTRQLTSTNKVNAKFQADLARLAGMGYGDLASQLAAQGDTAAQQLAASAVKDKGKASAANKQAKTANNTLTSEQVADLVQIIAAISTSKTGIHTVAEKTGLGEDEIIAVATKARSQIKGSLGGRSTKFLADLAAANAGRAYADGGIRAGMYATSNGIIRFAEPSTRGEAYIPLGAGKRRSATNVLADVAGRFGLGLTDAGAGRVVVIREQGPLMGSVNIHVTKTNATAYDIAAQVGRQARKASRGGVAARG